MTKEQLEHGKNIRAKIKELEDHLQSLDDLLKKATSPQLAVVHRDYNNRVLYSKFLIMPWQKIIDLYIEEVKKEIARLEAEFKNL